MTRIESPVVELKSSAANVAEDFQKWESFGELLSQGPVTDFVSDGDQCSFKVTGGVAIHLKRLPFEDVPRDSALSLITIAPTPVKFELDVLLTETPQGCECQVVCEAELNPFTKMMVEPALKGLFHQMADALRARY